MDTSSSEQDSSFGLVKPTPIFAEAPVLTTPPVNILVLQHPQEARNPVNSAQWVPSLVQGAKLKVGLSWRSLSQAWGEPAEPHRWVVLFLGSKKEEKGFEKDKPSPFPLRILPKRGGNKIPFREIEGLILLDGNWKQAKTLWWRNPWFLKCQRAVLVPEQISTYGNLRQQPRKLCLSTLEALSQCLRSWKGCDEAVQKLWEASAAWTEANR